MKQKELLILSIVIFLTIVAWVIFQIHQVRTQSDLDEQFAPPPSIKKKINADVFVILQKKTP